jgi:starch-binding outer membrane protein, SusD/RagB family
MKTKILFTILATLLLASCSDLLDESPKSIAVETFYNTPEEVGAALNAIYPCFNGLDVMGYYWALDESSSDMAYGRGSYAILSTYVGLDVTNTTRIQGVWSATYRAIRNANICIERIPLGTGLTEQQKKVFLGEAHFMRAFSYIMLVKHWGGVPLRTEENMSDLKVPRSPAAAIWDLILKDLLFARDNLSDTPRMEGVPTIGSANALMTEAYLWQGKNSDALASAKALIQSGKFSLVEITAADDFDTKLFGITVDYSPEKVFYLKYSRLLQGNAIPPLAHHASSPYLHGFGYMGQFTDTKNPIIRDWDNTDLRYVYNWYTNKNAPSATALLNKKFQDKEATTNGGSNDMPYYRYAEILLWFAEAEARVNGVTAAAVDALNQVRRRAYGKPSKVVSTIDFKTTDFANVDAFINRVVLEYGYETVFEGKRWNYLTRLGIATQQIKTVKGLDVQVKHFLWPIVINETNYNTAIDPVKDQNPGY